MKKVVKRIVAYDDVHLAVGLEVEADVEASVKIGDETFTLDLTDVHAEQMRADLKRWIEAATPKPERASGRRRPGDPGIPICRKPAAGMARQEAYDFLAGLREWAAAEGRSNEILRKGSAGRLASYSYGQLIVDDYRKYLILQASLKKTG